MVNGKQIQVGNAVVDAADRGWFVGSFINEKFGLRHTDDVELRWAVHDAGVARKGWAIGDAQTTICVLISGQVDFEFRSSDGPDKTSLIKQGDFVMWGPGTDHSWRANTDSVTIAIRWKPRS